MRLIHLFFVGIGVTVGSLIAFPMGAVDSEGIVSQHISVRNAFVRVVHAQPVCSGGAQNGTCMAVCPVAQQINAVPACAGGDFCCLPAAPAPVSPGGTADVSVPNPLGFQTVEDFLTQGILVWLQGIVVTLALVFFIIGALLYIMGGADEGNVKKGKAAMTAAVIGLALALAAPTFLQEIYTILGAQGAPAGPTLVQIALNVLRFLLSIIGIITTIMLIVSGLTWMSSAGSDEQVKTAKSMAKAAVIGLTLAMAALIIVRQISLLFV